MRFCDRHKLPLRAPWLRTDYTTRQATGGRYFTFYKSKQWERLSYSYRLKHPLCEWCERRGLYVPVAVVDHITPIRVDWSRRYDESNLQSLCAECHSIKSHDDIIKYHLPTLKHDDTT
ncbi:HNH endonuclease signature motif containing protein [Lacticaseibacillus pabuli]|uniref:Putative HNH nuclease YajD n=1 Tax=Lacticaseibacillus pabuli TaxID=3025672 RepID=A0ABY7X117_9LACO|nr:HNH endonuclease signature motif containing protein [Lacticaseibacillus sp. KACC 23028]WDF83860.1 HNH endonuclease signature motif containing protein [Lacticaseibacillus sp. KACC 23028]